MTTATSFDPRGFINPEQSRDLLVKTCFLTGELLDLALVADVAADISGLATVRRLSRRLSVAAHQVAELGTAERLRYREPLPSQKRATEVPATPTPVIAAPAPADTSDKLSAVLANLTEMALLLTSLRVGQRDQAKASMTPAARMQLWREQNRERYLAGHREASRRRRLKIKRAKELEQARAEERTTAALYEALAGRRVRQESGVDYGAAQTALAAQKLTARQAADATADRVRALEAAAA